MTPEERAAKIVEDENWYDFDYRQVGPDGDEMPIETIDRTLLRDEIAAAIRAAVEAERERLRATVETTQRVPSHHRRIVMAYWCVVTEQYEDGGVPLCDKWIEFDGKVILRAASNFPLDTPEGAAELAALDLLCSAYSGTLVRAAVDAERERCARVCDELRIEGQTQSAWVSEWADSGSLNAAEELARRIRALSHDSLAASASDNSPGGT